MACRMRLVEAESFHYPSIGKDKIQTLFCVEHFLENTSKRVVVRNIRLVESRVGQALGCLLASFCVEVEKVDVPTSTFGESLGNGQTHATGTAFISFSIGPCVWLDVGTTSN